MSPHLCVTLIRAHGVHGVTLTSIPSDALVCSPLPCALRSQRSVTVISVPNARDVFERRADVGGGTQHFGTHEELQTKDAAAVHLQEKQMSWADLVLVYVCQVGVQYIN